MPRKPTPSPEARFFGGGAIVVLVLSMPFIVVYLLSGWWWLLLFLLPGLLYILHKLYGFSLLIAAWLRWRGSRVKGVLVLSDSPNWKEYIENQWLPRLGDQVVVLNWSHRSRGGVSLPVLLFHHFCLTNIRLLGLSIGESNSNFNPALILLRGIRYPHVYRYFYAFRDAKHGRPEALKELESRMYSEFDRAGHAASPPQ